MAVPKVAASPLASLVASLVASRVETPPKESAFNRARGEVNHQTLNTKHTNLQHTNQHPLYLLEDAIEAVSGTGVGTFGEEGTGEQGGVDLEAAKHGWGDYPERISSTRGDVTREIMYRHEEVEIIK